MGSVGGSHLDQGGAGLGQHIGHAEAAADLDQPLIVTCYHGHSSQSAAAYLVNQGFSDVYSLDGGFELWRHTYPADVERGEEQA